MGYLIQLQVLVIYYSSWCTDHSSLYGPYIRVYYCNVYSGFLPHGILYPGIKTESCVISTAKSLYSELQGCSRHFVTDTPIHYRVPFRCTSYIQNLYLHETTWQS